MRKLGLLISAAILLVGCSTTTDMKEDVAKQTREQAEKLVSQATDQVNAKIEETLTEFENAFDNTVFGKKTNTAGTTEQIPVEFIRVKDGDTIVVQYENQEHTVRYLLTDTPESVHPSKQPEPFGKEASTRNEELLQSGRLTIEFDVGERFDKYGRLLAYVYVDGESVNEKLIREGLARVAYVHPPNTRHLDRFTQAEELAKREKLGIWSDY